MKRTKKIIGCLLSVALVLSLLAGISFADDSAKAADSVPVLTFSESGIAETVSGTGYTINGKALTISTSGVYKITGTCSNGSIDVKKNLTGVVLILEDLDLTASETAPIVIKKGSSATIHLEGSNKLTDSENPANETSTDPDVADAFEGAAIKVKSGSALTICGSGSLDVYGNAKNGIKGASEASITIKNGTINVKNAANSGLACDGSIVIDGGNINIKCSGDGIKSSPDTDDTASAGSITINGGTIDIDANEDGIYADSALTINNGNITVKTFGGYQANGFNSDTMSAKGLKSVGERTGVEHTITINGGVISLNTKDDAIHSDEYVLINGGTLDIYAGDDGVHANTTLFIGTEDGKERDPEITIHASYEGLEAGSIFGYSGKVYVTASDDGINSAGGSSNGSDPGQGGSGGWNPGGGGPGGRPGPGGGGPGGGGGDGGSTYHMTFYGGTYFVDCSGDGIDANGDLNMYGGTFTVLSMQQGGDNSPLDTNGNLNINGATVFGAGSNPMNENPSSTSQKYTAVTTSYSAGTILNVKSGSNTLYTEKLLRKVNYTIYSNPSITSNVTVSTGSLDSCNSNAWAHNWGSEEVVTAATETTEGLAKYTCTDCSAVEYKTIPKTVSTACEAGHDLSAPVVTQAPGTTATPAATAKPTATPAVTAKPTATPAATAKPTATPTVRPTATPTAKPTATPTVKPTEAPATAAPATEAPATEAPADPTTEPKPDTTEAPQSDATAAPQTGATSAPNNTQSTATTAPANSTTDTAVGNGTQTGTSDTVLKVASIVCKANAKKITGKLSVAKATVKIKVGNNKFKKATIKGKKFTLKLSYKLKKKTKIQVKVTKSGYSAFKKTYTVK